MDQAALSGSIYLEAPKGLSLCRFNTRNYCSI